MNVPLETQTNEPQSKPIKASARRNANGPQSKSSKASTRKHAEESEEDAMVAYDDEEDEDGEEGAAWQEDERVCGEVQYFEQEGWKRELAAGKVADWDTAQSAEWLRRLGKDIAGKRGTRCLQYATVVEAERLNGALLLAGGAEILAEYLQRCAHVERTMAKTDSNDIIEHLKAAESMATESQSADGYWEVMLGASEQEERVILEFAKSSLAKPFRDALRPHPRKAIRYTYLDELPRLDVKCVHKAVCSWPLSRDKHKKFHVVCVGSKDKPGVVQKNFIFFKGDERWESLASVDFVRHGSAMPGHWHLNRSPDGNKMQHWGPSIADIFHGGVRRCPLWWQMVPVGKRYLHPPDRDKLIEWCS